MGHSKQEETYQWTLGTQEPTPIGAALVFQWTVKVPIIGPHNSHRLQTRCTLFKLYIFLAPMIVNNLLNILVL